MQEMPDSKQIFRGKEDEKLVDIAITKKIEQEIEKLKSLSQGPNKIYLRILKMQRLLVICELLSLGSY